MKGSCLPTKATAGHSQAPSYTQRKLHMHENIKAIPANIRGINASGKRQILSAKWEKEGIDIALLSEVQNNTGGMEKEGHWGKYTVFFSTGINPKKREELERSRERKACETKKRNRKKGEKLTLLQFPKPNPSSARDNATKQNRDRPLAQAKETQTTNMQE